MIFEQNKVQKSPRTDVFGIASQTLIQITGFRLVWVIHGRLIILIHLLLPHDDRTVRSSGIKDDLTV